MSIPVLFIWEYLLVWGAFFHQIQGFPQFQLPLAMLWKREPSRIWGGKFDPKNFHDHLRGQTEWQMMAWFIDNALSCNLMPCQTNQLYTFEVPIPLRHPRMCQWFYNSRSNDQKRLQWAGLFWHKCCLVFVPTRYTTLFLGIQKKWPRQCDRKLGWNLMHEIWYKIQL